LTCSTQQQQQQQQAIASYRVAHVSISERLSTKYCIFIHCGSLAIMIHYRGSGIVSFPAIAVAKASCFTNFACN